MASRCAVHVSLLSEVDGDGALVYGVEIVVPCVADPRCSEVWFFWAPRDLSAHDGYQQAAFQAVVFLQGRYGFWVLDYSFRGIVLCRRVTHLALSIATRALGLARFVVDQWHPSPQLSEEFDELVQQVALLSRLG